MSQVRDFLLEIGTEELPPTSLKRLSLALADGVQSGLKRAVLSFDTCQVFATPRRLALLIKDLSETAPERNNERRGPQISAAYDKEGKPTPAALGFARSCHTDFEKLETLKNEKGEWLVFREQQTGQRAAELLPSIVQHACQKLPIPKPMRWANFPTQFIRPVHSIVMLYGDDVVEATLLGKPSGRMSFGHRFHHAEKIELKNASNYEAALKAAYVMADFEKRRGAIEEQIQELADKQKATVVPDAALLDEVTGLVEWPVAMLAHFEPQFLQVPAEALVAAMRDHQKCFHLLDDNEKLLPHFITVNNIESQNPAEVRKGNERVMRARLSDAAFFYQKDLKSALESHVEQSKHVVFQVKLGSLYDKAKRLETLASQIATIINSDEQQAARAGLLSHCDLMTDMVGEFPELQGVMGYYYATHGNEKPSVAIALREQYLPRFAGDTLPTESVGCALALATRIDTLVGSFGINQIPSGEKDPFGLRRAGLGVVRLIIEKQFSIKLINVLEHAATNYSLSFENENVVMQVHNFIVDRMRAWYADQGIAADVFAAVLERGSDDLFDFHRRIQAVSEFRLLSQAAALAAANKRVSKLLKKQTDESISEQVNADLFELPAESDLAELITMKQKAVEPLYAGAKYTEALNELASLREPVDRFFDEVMVMVDDEKLRANRLALLASLRRLFLHVADISLLQDK